MIIMPTKTDAALAAVSLLGLHIPFSNSSYGLPGNYTASLVLPGGGGYFSQVFNHYTSTDEASAVDLPNNTATDFVR
jgi:hypothetical protein